VKNVQARKTSTAVDYDNRLEWKKKLKRYLGLSRALEIAKQLANRGARRKSVFIKYKKN
jgi:hypothetical protein